MTKMAHLSQIALQIHSDPNEIPTQKKFPSSSPPLPPSSSQGSSKPKKRSTVTPRTFTRFFTPRPSTGRTKKAGTSRKILRDITASGSNRSVSTPFKDITSTFDQTADTPIIVSRKRKRRTVPSPVASLDQSSPLKERGLSLKMSQGNEHSGSEDQLSISDSEEQVSTISENYSDQSTQPKLRDQPSVPSWRREPIKPIVFARLSGWMPYRSNLRRELLGMNNVQGYKCAFHDYRNEVACFYSRPIDSFEFPRNTSRVVITAPFSTASCNTNTIVAVGDDSGRVTLLESAENGKPDFEQAFLIFSPHSNAIVDLCFSSDDQRLATAAGDNTAKIIDMFTQQTTHILNHDTTAKQVRFQPGGSDIVATSTRDGGIKIWDLRCKGAAGERGAVQVRPVDSIDSAHGFKGRSLMIWSTAPSAGRGILGPRSNDDRNSASVTSLSFLNAGRENLFVTGSDRNARIKLWDLRKMHSHRRHGGTPLSTTDAPESHQVRRREFGLTSLALSGDGQRLYAQCTDNTVYTYATSHLLNGQAPELSSANLQPRQSAASNQLTIGPLYGFAHDAFTINGFYVKMAIRPATPKNSEVIAVGSTLGSPVLFPTDERYLHFSPYGSCPAPLPLLPSLQPQEQNQVRQARHCRIAPPRHPDYIPIYRSGVKLRGHDMEVSDLTWTSDGDLVTVSDDATVKCWRQGTMGEAKSLRARGRDATTMGYGWADVDTEWDNDDE